jgi:hypothetical protein
MQCPVARGKIVPVEIRYTKGGVSSHVHPRDLHSSNRLNEYLARNKNAHKDVIAVSSQARRSKEIVIASLAVVVIAVLAVALLGDSGHPPQQTFSKATLSGKITGKVYTPGNAVGNVTALLFRPVNNSTQLKGLPANLDANEAIQSLSRMG